MDILKIYRELRKKYKQKEIAEETGIEVKKLRRINRKWLASHGVDSLKETRKKLWVMYSKEKLKQFMGSLVEFLFYLSGRLFTLLGVPLRWLGKIWNKIRFRSDQLRLL